MSKLSKIGQLDSVILKSMRASITNDEELRNSLNVADGSEIESILKDRFNNYPEEEVSRVAQEIASETLKLRENPGTYLVDSDNGKVLFKLTKDMVYNPPDSINEDGSPRRQLPMLHPKLSSGIALLIQDKELFNKLEKISEKSPESIAHLKDPWRIIEHTIPILEKSGIILVNEDLPEEIIIIIGMEHGDLGQSMNINFHRSVSYGASLAKKVLELNAKMCKFLDVERKKTSKRSWYEVKLSYSR